MLLPFALLLAAVVPSVGASTEGTPAGALEASTQRPHIVLVLSDDQRWDTLPGVAPQTVPQKVMLETHGHLMQRGVVFTQAFSSTPLCAPFRASFLAGGHRAADTGVLSNKLPNGGATRFEDARSLAVRMQQAGYRTAFVGKYMNEFELVTGQTATGQPIPAGRYVPPGWDVFIHRPNSKNWFKYGLLVGSSGPDAPTRGVPFPGSTSKLTGFLLNAVQGGFPFLVADYLLRVDPIAQPYVTEFDQDVATRVLATAAQSNEPWFILVATQAPHLPAMPDPVDTAYYDTFTYQGRSWGEDDVSDKPAHVQAQAPDFHGKYDPSLPRVPDDDWQDQLQSMRALDRMVGVIGDLIDSKPSLADNTVYGFASDNGYLWGEHRQFAKRSPYEESIRVPFIIRGPGLSPGVRHQLVALELDLPATVLELAGFTQKQITENLRSDGVSLLPILASAAAPGRDHLILESFGTEGLLGLNATPAWAGIRTRTRKFVEYAFDAQGVPALEHYDLVHDPLELSSLHLDPVQSRLQVLLAQNLQRGRSVMQVNVPRWDGALAAGQVGQVYDHRFQATGGTPPYQFRRYSGAGPLPPGLTLGVQGRLQGTPQLAGEHIFQVVVEDSSVSPQHGGPQSHVTTYRLVVTP